MEREVLEEQESNSDNIRKVDEVDGIFSGEDFDTSDSSVSARGTQDGLILRIDGRAKWSTIISDVESFLGSREKFFHGAKVSIEWLERLPTKEQSKLLETQLKERFAVEVIARHGKKDNLPDLSEEASSPLGRGSDCKKGGKALTKGVTIPLFKELEREVVSLREQVHIEQVKESDSDLAAAYKSDLLASEGISKSKHIERDAVKLNSKSEGGGEFLFSGELAEGRKHLDRSARLLGEDVFFDDDANAKVIFGTLRSGQRIETPFSLVVVGDVNPGADLIAGGDIIVVGSLRGTAHAAAYDEETPDRVIIAMQLNPIQLRIGSVISRGSDDVVHGAEIARIDDRRIVVEAFNSRLPIGGRMFR